MCRSIKVLRRADGDPDLEEIHAAALQFVRKVSGYRSPSVRNRPAFDVAVDAIATATAQLLSELPTLRRVTPPGVTGRNGSGANP